MLRNYSDVRDWLEEFIPLVYGKEELGLARIENLLSKLGNPQKKFKSIHVGGTAGKGSTAFYISQLLINKGYEVGLHISPHLVDIRERMQIFGNRQNVKGDTLMPVSRFVGLANQIKPVVDDIIAKQPQLIPSYFEILVAMAFLHFAKEKVDFAVVEVGLGGRLDATNVLLPEISVITNVGLDHTEILGNTVERIAEEKAGIIKGPEQKARLLGQVDNKSKAWLYSCVPVVTEASGKALEVIKKAAKGKNAPLITLDTQGELKTPKSDLLRPINKQYYSLRSHGGFFASQNKNLALATVLSLGIKLDSQTVKKAFSRGFQGRFEEIPTSPRLRGTGGVILDGAHNPEKIQALIDFFRNSKLKTQNSKLILVIGFKQGKDWKKMVDLLVTNFPVREVIATEYQSVTDTGKGSAVGSEVISDYIRVTYHLLPVTAFKNSQEAVFTALSSNKLRSDQLVLVTGSLYLVGEARTLWQLPEF